MSRTRTSEPNLLIDGPRRARQTIVLAHGAGAGMDTEFMNTFAAGLTAHGLRVVRFEFPYMAARRETGESRPPDREPVLRETWLRVIGAVRAERLFIGGKSMGGRIASLIADEAQVDGLVCLGYPFHPAGKPERLRMEHLQTIRTPTLILQGSAIRSAIGRRLRRTSSRSGSASTGCRTAITDSSRGSHRGTRRRKTGGAWGQWRRL